MDELAHQIVEHYEGYDEASRITVGVAQLELLRTREIVRRHLPGRMLRILDVGGGTGVHASWLAADGHTIHVIDLVHRHVEQARHRPAEAGRITAEVGDARELAVEDDSFDAVLVLGPLYHLTERDDRLRALREAGRAVRPGGLVFAAAISRFASLFDGLARGFIFDPEFGAIVVQDLREGQHRNPERRPDWFTTAFFHRPDELREEVQAAGLDVVELVGVEGLAAWLPQLAPHWDDGGEREVILSSARSVESEPSLLGMSPHLLVVGRRPLAAHGR